MIRWTLENMARNEAYVFPINPNAQESPFEVRGVSWSYNGADLGWSGQRQGRAPRPWSFSGVLRSEAQYEALKAWATRTEKLRLTDDRGDVYVLRILEFQPVQQGRPRNRHAPWRMTYTVRASVYSVEARAT